MFIKIFLTVLLATNFQYLNGLSVVVKETIPFTFEDSPPQPQGAPIMDGGQFFVVFFKKKKNYLIIKIQI